MSYSPDRTFSRATRNVSAASATSSGCGASPPSPTKPRPMGWISNPGRNSGALSSPYFHEPLMNWTMETRSPWPTARRARPRAAVVFPLPSPVWTMTSPRRATAFPPARPWAAQRLRRVPAG